jgi:hypothetical protein
MKAVAGRGGVRRVSTDLVGPKEMELMLRIFPTHPLHVPEATTMQGFILSGCKRHHCGKPVPH